MSDSKVTDMTLATSVNPTDVLYLVQSATDKQITIATLLGTIPNTPFLTEGLVGLSGTAQTLVDDGIITTSETVTLISNDTATATLTINNGTINGQLKVIICTSASGTSSLVAGPATIAFSRAGHTALLMWINNVWYVVGGTATISL